MDSTEMASINIFLANKSGIPYNGDLLMGSTDNYM